MKESLQQQATDYTIDYHHISSFFSTEIFSHPRLRNVTYYLRMDTNSILTEPLCYDPFKVMDVRRRSYGYLSIGSGSQEYTEGLSAFVYNYSLAHTAVEQRLRAHNWEWSHQDEKAVESLQFVGYDTNFEIVKLAAFRHPDVKEWLDAIQSYPEGIYKWRWG
jgi:mannosyltransferase